MTISTSLFRSGVLPGLLLVAVCVAQPAEGQKGRRITRTPQELLAAFPQHLAPGYENSATTIDIGHIATYPEDYPSAELEVFLRGVERLALAADSPRVRQGATLYLSTVGARSRSLPVAPILPRLMRIYRGTNDPVVREYVTEGMAFVADRAEALAFLERVATEHPEPFRRAAETAISALIVIGEDARPVLKRLHESGAVRDATACARLEGLARNNYRLPR